MTHPRPVQCVNCHLTIQPGEPLVRVDTAELKRRRRRAGIRWSYAEDAPIRYRHATYQDCSEAEARAAAW